MNMSGQTWQPAFGPHFAPHLLNSDRHCDLDPQFGPKRISMRNSTDSTNLAVIEEVAPCSISPSNDAPMIIVGHGFASNDAACEDPTMSADDAECRTPQARAASAFTDDAVIDAASSARPSNYQLYRAARANRSFMLGETIVAAFHSAGAIARRAYAHHRQRRQARDVYDALRQLDDRMLRDLGFDRSEITSVAAEMTREAEYTRMRVLMTSHIFPH
jgi:uncharacterized protein YjiS (DUF1127 family)